MPFVVVPRVVKEYAAGPASSEAAASVPAASANQRGTRGRAKQRKRTRAETTPVTTTVGPTHES